MRRSFLRRIFVADSRRQAEKLGGHRPGSGEKSRKGISMIYGNIEGIRESLLKEMETLYDLQLEEN